MAGLLGQLDIEVAVLLVRGMRFVGHEGYQSVVIVDHQIKGIHSRVVDSPECASWHVYNGKPKLVAGYKVVVCCIYRLDPVR